METVSDDPNPRQPNAILIQLPSMYNMLDSDRSFTAREIAEICNLSEGMVLSNHNVLGS